VTSDVSQEANSDDIPVSALVTQILCASHGAELKISRL